MEINESFKIAKTETHPAGGRRAGGPRVDDVSLRDLVDTMNHEVFEMHDIACEVGFTYVMRSESRQSIAPLGTELPSHVIIDNYWLRGPGMQIHVSNYNDGQSHSPPGFVGGQVTSVQGVKCDIHYFVGTDVDGQELVGKVRGVLEAAYDPFIRATKGQQIGDALREAAAKAGAE